MWQEGFMICLTLQNLNPSTEAVCFLVKPNVTVLSIITAQERDWWGCKREEALLKAMFAFSASVNTLSFTCTPNVFLFEGICTRSRKRKSMGLLDKSGTRGLMCRGGAIQRAEVRSPPQDTDITSHYPLHPTLFVPTRCSRWNPGASSWASSCHGCFSAASSQTDRWGEHHDPHTKKDQSGDLEFKALGEASTTVCKGSTSWTPQGC